MPETLPPDPVYRFEFTIPASALDANGHVNNVQYVQWMQDVAVRHFSSIGGTAPMRALQATWVVRAHHIEYLAPAFLDELIEVRTWVANIRRVRSLRRYEFTRLSDGQLLVRGETEWVFVHAGTGRPLAIPAEVAHILPLLPDP